jgi:hypothetical protein
MEGAGSVGPRVRSAGRRISGRRSSREEMIAPRDFKPPRRVLRGAARIAGGLAVPGLIYLLLRVLLR